jgi:hypothetical protein
MIAGLGVVVFAVLVQIRSRIRKSVTKGVLFQLLADVGKVSIPMHFRHLMISTTYKQEVYGNDQDKGHSRFTRRFQL